MQFHDYCFQFQKSNRYEIAEHENRLHLKLHHSLLVKTLQCNDVKHIWPSPIYAQYFIIFYLVCARNSRCNFKLFLYSAIPHFSLENEWRTNSFSGITISFLIGWSQIKKRIFQMVQRSPLYIEITIHFIAFYASHFTNGEKKRHLNKKS